MRRYLVLPLCVFALLQPCAAGDDFGVWNYISMRKQLNAKWEMSMVSEARTIEWAPNHFYMRPAVAFNASDNFQFKMQTDFACLKSGFNLRYLPEVTYRVKFGGFNFGLRERLMVTWVPSDDSYSAQFRTKATLSYTIPGTHVAPLVAVEPFYWDSLSRVRYHAGIKFRLGRQCSVTLQYMRQDYYTVHNDENIIWLMYSIDL